MKLTSAEKVIYKASKTKLVKGWIIKGTKEYLIESNIAYNGMRYIAFDVICSNMVAGGILVQNGPLIKPNLD